MVTGSTEVEDGLFLDVHPSAARRLLLAALESFSSEGYHATTTRSIATKAGMSPAAMYVHYRSKQDVLMQISMLGHQASLGVIRAAAASESDPVDRLRSIVRNHTRWHARNRDIARVAQYELISLTPENLAEVSTLRKATRQVLREAIDDGVAAARFQVADIDATLQSIASLSIDVARWYPGAWRGTVDDLADAYAELATRLVGASAHR